MKVFSAQYLMQGCFSLNTITILPLIATHCIGVTQRKEQQLLLGGATIHLSLKITSDFYGIK
jgi:hypothetical protein